MLRLNFSTYLLALPISAVLIFLVVPGVYQQPEYGSSLTKLSSYGDEYWACSHGWPLTFLTRTLRTSSSLTTLRIGENPTGYDKNSSLPWMEPGAWRFNESVESEPGEINWKHLALDAALALAVLIVLLTIWEWRIRRAGSVWRYRPIDLLAILLIVAILCAWFTSLQEESRDEQLRSLTIISLPTTSHVDIRDRRPNWLARLAGREFGKELFGRITRCYLYPNWTLPARGGSSQTVRNLRNYTSVFDHLSQLEYVQEIDLEFRTTEGVDLARLVNNRDLRFLKVRFHVLRERDIEDLGKLTQLKGLEVAHTTPEVVERLRALLPGCDVTR